MATPYDHTKSNELVLTARELCAQARAIIAGARGAVARAHVLMQQSRGAAAIREMEFAHRQQQRAVTHI